MKFRDRKTFRNNSYKQIDLFNHKEIVYKFINDGENLFKISSLAKKYKGFQVQVSKEYFDFFNQESDNLHYYVKIIGKNSNQFKKTCSMIKTILS